MVGSRVDAERWVSVRRWALGSGPVPKKDRLRFLT